MSSAPRSLTVPDEILAIFVKAHPQVFDPDTHRVLFALRAVAQRVNDRANEWLAPLGLTVGKYNYLVALGTARGQRLTLNEIGTFIHTKSATVTQMIAALERDGLVRRTSNPVDGRSTIAALTPLGKKRLRTAMELHHRAIEGSMQTFSTAERRTLFALLLKLGDAFGGTAMPRSEP
jgi:MarR family transcriptional regulator, transcriptional regulator for hemolysin